LGRQSRRERCCLGKNGWNGTWPWRKGPSAPGSSPIEVEDHDFIKDEFGKAISDGVYDLANNNAWVNVGIDHGIPEFAVASIQRWWTEMGMACYPEAKELLITADGGGSNGYRSRMWKVALQGLSDATGLKISACHHARFMRLVSTMLFVDVALGLTALK
jgi:hypothetical protein